MQRGATLYLIMACTTTIANRDKEKLKKRMVVVVDGSLEEELQLAPQASEYQGSPLITCRDLVGGFCDTCQHKWARTELA
jgi:hypothetical protein